MVAGRESWNDPEGLKRQAKGFGVDPAGTGALCLESHMLRPETQKEDSGSIRENGLKMASLKTDLCRADSVPQFCISLIQDTGCQHFCPGPL